ncbi:protein eva-1 isoform X3 [Aphidius gifuensis]|uniref:protein eva-1 isoform X3 n=1 Tax=Aphidius gifuensis TaxID=684658 RepID=UPI001CDC2E7D|nr:protein eva-1 isoform X3 [Aphidius gifuensis]
MLQFEQHLVTKMSVIIVYFLLLGHLQTAYMDNLAILSDTLKTYQKAACDEETMSLRCPPGTSISLTIARYGRISDINAGKCNNAWLPSAQSTSSTNNSCALPQALQYSLLQTVVEICQKKRNCKFNTSPKSLQNDPCPSLPKYIEVAYKCRPYEFRSKVACENDAVNLMCFPGKRVAIYSASFGRTEYESLQCPQPHGVKEETCNSQHATGVVMKMCHGKRKCSVIANGSTFDDTCKPDTRTYLKIIYTCVPRNVMREDLAGDEESDEKDLVPEFDEGFDRTDFKTEFSPSPNLEGPQPQPKDNTSANSPEVNSSPPRARTNNDRSIGTKEINSKHYRLPTDDKNDIKLPTKTVDNNFATSNCTTIVYAVAEEDRVVVGYINEWINAYSFISKNQEKFYLYIIISVSMGMLFFLSLVIGRLLISRHRAKRDAKFHTNSETLPNGFTDEISEIDADIDLTTPVPVPMQDTNIPETQLAERLHGDRYYGDGRMPLSMSIHHQVPTHLHGVRVDLGNHMIGADNLHTILRNEDPRNMPNKSYYYG